MARKTIEELEAAARAAEERAKKLRAKAKKQTQAEGVLSKTVIIAYQITERTVKK